MTTYKSKIGLALVIPISIIVGGTGIILAYERIWAGVVFILFVVVFILHMFITTYYQVDNSLLKIRCGFFFDKSISINTIKEIKETRIPISAPATSLDRIVIVYNKSDNIIISPKQKEAFIDHLTSINPSIKLTLKDNRKPL